MKAQKEYLSANIMHSFRVNHSSMRYLDTPWHFHPECELIYVVQGSGKRFVGDSIENFVPGDLVFLGANLPHVWKSDELYYQDIPNLNSEVIVIQFKRDAFGTDFFSLPELIEINKVIALSGHGLKIKDTTKERIVSEMWNILNMSGVMRISSLLTILNLMACSKDLVSLSSAYYSRGYYDKKAEQLNSVFDFVATNFQNKVQLDEVSAIAHMSKTAFCRFFKTKTAKTFHQYLTDVRISYACELLIESDWNIAEIGERCGYKNQSFFNRQFKAVKGITPREFSLKYKEI